MAMTNAERMKKYREKLKKDRIKYEEMKAKNRIRNNSMRIKLTGASLDEFRNKRKLSQRKYRQNKKQVLQKTPSTTNSFVNRQSFGKEIGRAHV